LKGKVLREEGFLEIMPWQAAEEKEVPEFKKG
jgi:DNA topoisomerase IA